MKKEIETESKSQETPIIIIKGFAKADGYALTDWDVLRRNLKKLHLLSERFGYRAISPRRIKHAFEKGTDRDDDFINLCLCSKEKGKKPRIVDDNTQLLDYMDDYRGRLKQAVFLVYDLAQITGAPYDAEGFFYTFRDPANKKQALVAIIVAEDF